MNCCEKYKGQKCPELVGEDLYKKCKDKGHCLHNCPKGYYRKTYGSKCIEHKTGCGLNEYRKSNTDTKCYSVATRKPIEGFMNFKNGKVTGVCPYAIIQILLLSTMLYLMVRLKDVNFKR
jgi:hypothetical protein